MILSESQHRSLKAIRWDDVRSRAVRSQTHDDKLTIGYDGKRKRWVIARVVQCTVLSKFGSRTIPTAEHVPFIWKIWEDDNGLPLSIDDPRLVPYIQRCDLWRQPVDKYMLSFDRQDWLDDCKERSESDDVYHKAGEAFDKIKDLHGNPCGYVPKYPVSTKWFGPTKWRQ